ncbi:M48 family metalloprotease [Phaeobacter sp.]|uniref:M48 family metalloprotease n=1 Tax=Phaeobacter sp. TaxID=1902409 RepID=UPI0025F11C39|nr:M48 family metalloprotease [Phaeobacter sp.]
MRRFFWILLLFGAACDVAVDTAGANRPGQGAVRPAGFSPAEAQIAFAEVRRVVEPVSERECRARSEGLNCDFLIRIDPNPAAPPNAYQSLDRSGRPIITFTRRMLGQIANRDELAFVMSHETAHHIRGHLARKRQSAVAGSILLAGLASASGASAADIARAEDIGAIVGARTYSKTFELEADELGSIITHKAGYRPSVGVRFFERLPDPGDRFLGTHPANPDRITVVNDTIRRYNLN